LSRYGKSCTFIELNKNAAKKVAENIQLLNLSAQQAQIIQGNTLDTLKNINKPYDLIFLDPPFNQNLLPKTIQLIDQNVLLSINGVIYIECEAQGVSYSVPENWQLIKEKRSSQILARVYQRNS
jgi:16S rRNA (guanine966-N2)-methyltransferase